MTGGTVVVLGPVGANFGAGMTGGRAFLYDPSGRHAAALNTASVVATRLSAILHERADGPERNTQLRSLLEDHRSAGSGLAARLLELDDLPATFWVVEPVALPTAVETVPAEQPTPTTASVTPLRIDLPALDSTQPLV